jgi:outer membrane receptor protein involved in Fe transport
MNPTGFRRALVPILLIVSFIPAAARAAEPLGIEITGERPVTPPAATPTVAHGRDEILETPAPDTGAVLTTLPGVEAVRRGASGLDPVVRSLQGDRVNVLVDGTRLYGGCPSRMDPPTLYVSPWSLERIEVIKGPYSVTDGPGGLGGTVKLDTHTLAVGGDGYRVARDATRDRTMTMMGMPMTTHDRLWPDTHITDLGLFAEWQRPLGARLTLGAGGRADRVTARADATDAASALAGATVEEAYVSFYGSDAADTERDEVNAGGNLRLGWQIDDRWQAHVAAGSAVRTADATERYAAFAPAPGGYRVGNPTLDPERSWQLDAGVAGTAGPLTLSADGFVNQVDDYILVTVIEDGLRDFNNDGVNDVVKGYHNLDRAFLWGGEVTATWAITDAWALAGSLTYTERQNRDDDQPLPEIAPLSGRLQLRYDDPDGHYWGAAGSRLVARQDRADAAFGEDETPGFTTFDVRGGRHFGERWQLTVAVENLFDRTLSRAPHPRGLPAGRRPGRRRRGARARPGRDPHPGGAILTTDTR